MGGSPRQSRSARLMSVRRSKRRPLRLKTADGTVRRRLPRVRRRKAASNVPRINPGQHLAAALPMWRGRLRYAGEGTRRRSRCRRFSPSPSSFCRPDASGHPSRDAHCLEELPISDGGVEAAGARGLGKRAADAPSPADHDGRSPRPRGPFLRAGDVRSSPGLTSLPTRACRGMAPALHQK